MIETRVALPFAAVFAAWLIHWLGGFPLFAAATIALAVYASLSPPARNNVPIADIAAGQWLALWALSGGLWVAGAPPHIFPYPGWIGALVLFQAFDWLLGGAQTLRRRLIAGACAALATLLVAAVSHGWLT